MLLLLLLLACAYAVSSIDYCFSQGIHVLRAAPHHRHVL